MGTSMLASSIWHRPVDVSPTPRPSDGSHHLWHHAPRFFRFPRLSYMFGFVLVRTIRAHGDRLDAMADRFLLQKLGSCGSAKWSWTTLGMDRLSLLGWLSRLGRLRLGCRWRGSGFIGFGDLDRRIADGSTDVVGVEFEAAALLPRLGLPVALHESSVTTTLVPLRMPDEIM